MAQSPIPIADSTASGKHPSTPRRASFLRHLHAENRSPSTRVTYAKAIDQLNAFLTAAGMPTDVAAIGREHLEHFLVALHERGMRPRHCQPWQKSGIKIDPSTGSAHSALAGNMVMSVRACVWA